MYICNNNREHSWDGYVCYIIKILISFFSIISNKEIHFMVTAVHARTHMAKPEI
jgi:hypothetical protein